MSITSVAAAAPAAPRRRQKPGRVRARRATRLPARRRAHRVWTKGWHWARLVVTVVLALALLLGVNWMVQVIRKPSELFFPLSEALYKSPSQTWRDYGVLFQKHSTPTMTAPFLAALAQQEGAGNPIARTYWRWALDYRPFEIYRPASSSVGMYQMTDGNFTAAKQWCIHDHHVARVGAWTDLHSCWFNGSYIRVLPGHAIELTSAYLDATTNGILARHRLEAASLPQRQHLAAAIHLCGAGMGERYVRQGFRFLAGDRCGAHDPRAYLAAVDRFERTFAELERH